MHLFDLLKALGCAVAASAVGGGVSGDRGPATAGVLPRIGVKNCAFVDTATGRAFHPIGFNSIRLQQHPEVPTAKWHSPFGVGHYSYEEAEGMFEASSRHGFNTTRVFLSHFNFAPVDDSKSLNPEVMDNLIDFLRLAAEYKTYVILTTCYQLPSAYYSSLGANDNNAQGWNGHYLNDRTIKNKVAYLGQLTQEIKDRAPELLSTVLAYDLDNEVQFTMKHEPFKSGGEFAFLGEPYDLDTSSEIQKLMDVSMTNWIDLCSDAVKAVDPHAMVSASVFSFHNIGRTSGPGWAREQKSQHALRDMRIPARPVAIATSKADYIDLHTYIGHGTNTASALDYSAKLYFHSIEYNDLVEVCTRNGKPLFAGEFGVVKASTKIPEEAGELIVQQVDLLAGYGLAGYLVWTFDGHAANADWQNENWWPGTAEDNTILRMMSENIPKTPWRDLHSVEKLASYDYFYDARFVEPEDESLEELTVNLGAPMPVRIDGKVIFPSEAYKQTRFQVNVAASGRELGSFGKGLYSTWCNEVSQLRMKVSDVSFGPDSVIVGGHHHREDAPEKVKLSGEWHQDYWTTPGKGQSATWATSRLRKGNYDVYVYVGDDPNKDHAAKAVYKLESGNKQHWFSVNQRAMTNRWVHAGRFPLAGRAKVFLFCAEKTGNYIADSVAFKPAVEVSSGGREYCVRAFFPIEANKRPFKMTINGRDIGAVDVAQLTKLDRHTAVLEQVVSASGDVLIAFPGESKPSVSCVQVEKPERQSETPRP